MPSLTRFLRALCGANSASRHSSRHPDFRARLSLNSLEQLEDRVTPSAVTPTDINAWSAQLAALPATQTLGNISVATSLAGNGGVNVIDVEGDIKANVVLTGIANDVFIVNVHGNLILPQNRSLGVAGGVTADHVIYNFVRANGTGNILAMRGEIDGTVLAPTYVVHLHGTTLNGEIFSNGPTTQVDGGTILNDVPFVPPSTSVPNATISGHARISDGLGGFYPASGIGVTLTFTDADGLSVSMMTQTDDNGDYSFGELAAGTYTISFDSPFGGTATLGTVDGHADGALLDSLTIASIDLLTGNSVGANYDLTVPPII